MSFQHDFEITCPECGMKQKTTVWRSINATVDPELRIALFEGKVNWFVCKKCGHSAEVTFDLLYNDMRREFLVQYYPFHWLEEDERLASFTAAGEWASGMDGEGDGYMFEPAHVVFDMGELVRYVIFRERLFDVSRKAVAGG
jgi:hypothetical protein